MKCALIIGQLHNNADYNRAISLFNPTITPSKAPYTGDQQLPEDDNDIIQFSTTNIFKTRKPSCMAPR